MSTASNGGRRFRKKPVEIEAVQWDGQNYAEIRDFVGESLDVAWSVGGYCFINTLEGRMNTAPGDWVIKGVQGEFYPCKPGIFDATYEPVELDSYRGTSVSAIIVTRGDHDLGEILGSLPDEWERIIWDNHAGITIFENEADWRGDSPPQPDNWTDLSVYGRYAAIEYASNELIYVQDDDCVVSDAAAVVAAWHANRGYEGPRAFVDHVVCNMPPEFRHGFYEDHALVGFGACFHRDAPAQAFAKMLPSIMASYRHFTMSTWLGDALVAPPTDDPATWPDLFRRTCDVVFTALTPRVLVDVPYENLPWATDETRMYRQKQHIAEREQMLALALQVRDA